jgi:hypothetical protein
MASAGVSVPWQAPWIAGNKTAAQVTADICAPLERRASGWWWLAFLPAFSLLVLGIAAVSYQIAVGIGTWGLNRTVGWAFHASRSGPSRLVSPPGWVLEPGLERVVPHVAPVRGGLPSPRRVGHAFGGIGSFRGEY